MSRRWRWAEWLRMPFHSAPARPFSTCWAHDQSSGSDLSSQYAMRVTLPGRRSELEPVEPHPLVRLPGLLDVEALVLARPRHRRGAPEGRRQLELLAEFLGGPDLPGVHVGLDARGPEHRVAAGDHERAVAGLPAGLDLAVVE